MLAELAQVGDVVKAGHADLNAWARREWQIENRLTLREDEQRASTARARAVFAALRNTGIGFHRLLGHLNIACVLRSASSRTSDLIQAVTRNGTTTR